MLTDAKITTMLPVADVERARRFYADRLGLREVALAEDGMRVFEAGAGAIGLRQAGPGAQSEQTALTFHVPDLEREVEELIDRGVTFADYDLPDLKTVDHIAKLGDEKAAWFNDTEGNILCVHQTT
jgi:catechol 2,3-dioxygenase-like lactoylglutathione lyase family enzyme